MRILLTALAEFRFALHGLRALCGLAVWLVDGGAGRDVLIGGRSKSELWGGSGADTFDLSRESLGIQWIMDFDPDIDQLHLDQAVGAYEIDVRGNDLWLLTGERAVAVFEGLVDQHDILKDLIG